MIACGVWSPRIAAMAGATIPLTPAVHQMIDVGPIPELEATGNEIGFPIVRDMDTFCYERQTGGSMEVGSYAHRPIFHYADDIPSIKESRLSPTELPFTADDFDQQLEEALELMPDILSTAEMKYAINGLLSLTPDGFPLLGETAEVRNLWSAAAVWIKEGPGVGRMIAEWMTNGAPEIDPHHSDITRFYRYARNDHHVRARCAEHFNKTYGIVHPREQWASERNIRCAPYHARTEALGAVYFQAGGWERPHWYESNAPLVEHYGIADRPHEWDARWWSPIMNAEHLALRETRRHDRPRAVRDLRHQRPGRARLPPAPHGQQLQRRGRPFDLHAAARRATAASAPTSRSCASPTTRSAWSPARSTAHATSTGSARISPTTARSRSSTTPPRSRRSACGARTRGR